LHQKLLASCAMFSPRLLVRRVLWLYLYFCSVVRPDFFLFFFFNDTATTEIYTLSLHDALPIYFPSLRGHDPSRKTGVGFSGSCRSEEHTSELQSPYDLVCRLLLEKKKSKTSISTSISHPSHSHSPSPVPASCLPSSLSVPLASP